MPTMRPPRALRSTKGSPIWSWWPDVPSGLVVPQFVVYPSGAKRTEPNFSNNLGCDDETPTREVLAISLFHR